MTTMRYPRSLNRCRNRGLPYLTGVGSDKGVMVIIPFPLSTDQRFNQLVANLEAVNLYISTFIAQYLNMDIGLRTHHESVVSHLTVVLDSELNTNLHAMDDECEYDQMLKILLKTNIILATGSRWHVLWPSSLVFTISTSSYLKSASMWKWIMSSI